MSRDMRICPRQAFGPGEPEKMVALMGRFRMEGELFTPEGSPLILTWPVSSWILAPEGSWGAASDVCSWLRMMRRRRRRRDEVLSCCHMLEVGLRVLRCAMIYCCSI